MIRKLRWLVAVLVAATMLSAYFIWPTPWVYGVEYWESPVHREGSGHRVPVPIRTDRFTGEKQNQGGPEGEWGHFVW